MRRFCGTVLLFVVAVSALHAADWPGWQGPGRDNKSAEKGLLKVWPKDGPKLKWTFENAGAGYSSPAVVGDYLFMTGARGDDTYLYSISLATGKETWATKICPAFTFKGNAWGIGPRSSPVVSDDHVYALTGDGTLVCCATTSGKEVWRVHMAKDLKGQVNPIGGGPKDIGWGYSWAPLVDGEKLICMPGGPNGTFAALNKKTGKVLWQSSDLKEQAVYSSPIKATIGGVEQYIGMTQTGVSGVNATTGKLLWSYQRRIAYPDVVIPTPVVQDNFVYITAGYGAGCDLAEITHADGKFTTKKVYSNKTMKNTLGGVVYLDGCVYGASERKGWVCQDFKTGKSKWSKKNVLGPGSVVYADGHLYCYSENDGVVALVEASSKEWNEKSRFTIPKMGKLQAPSSRKWTHPVVANGMLYIRDQELLFCFQVK